MFPKRRNRTLDCHVFLSRQQTPSELLNQFWHPLNGLAAKCNFGDKTESLVYNIFVLNMVTKQVQVKLRTEPKETPAEALKFAFAFEDGLKRRKSHGYINQEPEEEPICAVSNCILKECWRCSAGILPLII